MAEVNAGSRKEQGKTRVFLSYSRRDEAFAVLLREALEARGVDVFRDVDDTLPGEEWWKRLQSLIGLADTIVFILSSRSVASKVCQDEVAHAERLSKRVFPVVIETVDWASIPAGLAARHSVFFIDKTTQAAAFEQLMAALLTDIDWVREHTRLHERATAWQRQGHARGELLSGKTLEAAELWLSQQPTTAEAPTALHREFIKASRDATRRRRTAFTGAMAAGLSVAILLAGAAWWQRGLAIRNENQAKEQRDRALVGQSRFLANLALQKLSAGDAWGGALLALEGLVDRTSDKPMVRERPYATEPEDVLYASLDGPREARLIPYSSPLTRGSIHPAGDKIVTVSIDRTVELRDLKSGNHIRSFEADDDGNLNFNEHGNRWYGVLSPTGDRFLGLFGDHTARVWSVDTGKIVVALHGHTNTVLSGAFSPDGKTIATGSADATLRLWEASSGKQILKLDGGQVLSLAFSPDGAKIATGTRGSAQIWDLPSGKVVATLLGHSIDYLYDAINEVNFSADSKMLITAGKDTTARIWRVEDGQQVRVLSGHTDTVVSAMFHPDGKLALTASFDRTARLWNLDTGESITLNGHEGKVTSARFMPDGGGILTTSSDGTARIWSMTGPRKIAAIPASEARARKDGSRFSTLSGGPCESEEKALVQVWAADTVKLINRLCVGNADNGALSPDGRVFASLDAKNNKARIWVTDLGKETASAQLQVDVSTLSYVEFGPDQTFMSGAIATRRVGVWDLASGAQLAVLGDQPEEIYGAPQSPDGKLILVKAGKTASIWDWRKGKILMTRSDLAASLFGDNGSVLIAQSVDGTIRLWDIASGKSMGTIPAINELMLAGDVKRDQGRFVAGFGEGAVVAWDLATGKSMASIDGHGRAVVEAHLSADGARVLTASEDGKAIIWDIASGKRIALLEALGGEVLLTGARWFPGETRAVTLGLHNEALVSRVFPTTQGLVDFVKLSVPRCLSPIQRELTFLEPDPPAWCIDLKKWPYDTPEWTQWIANTRAGKKPSLPSSRH